MQLQVPCDGEGNFPTVDTNTVVVESSTITSWIGFKLIGSETNPLHQWVENYPHTREVCQLYAAISTVRREHSTIKNLELVWKVFLGTLSNNKFEIGWVLHIVWLCCTMLDFNSCWFCEGVGADYPVNPTNLFHILWELKLTTEWGCHVNLAFTHIRGKSIVWKLQFEAMM